MFATEMKSHSKLVALIERWLAVLNATRSRVR